MLARRSRALPRAGCSLALRLIPFEAITLSPGQAHQRISPVTSTTPPPPPPLQQRKNTTRAEKCYKEEEMKGQNQTQFYQFTY